MPRIGIRPGTLLTDAPNQFISLCLRKASGETASLGESLEPPSTILRALRAPRLGGMKQRRELRFRRP